MSWNKRTNLLRNTNSLADRIQVLQEWANYIDIGKLNKFLKSAFRSLNNPNRYQYYMQYDTVTHENFLTFMIVLNEICVRHKDYDWYNWCTSILPMNSSKSWLTLYYIFKVYILKFRDLFDIGLAIDEATVDSMPENARNGGHEFKDINYYDYMAIIKDALKSIGKTKTGKRVKDKPKRAYSELLQANETMESDIQNAVKSMDARIKGKKNKAKKKAKKINSKFMADKLWMIYDL